MDNDVNPFQSPSVTEPAFTYEETLTPHGAERIRRRYFYHEQCIRSLGNLFYLIAIAGISFGGAILLSRRGRADYFLPGLVGLSIGLVAIVLAVGARRLDRRFRVPLILSAFAIAFIPLPIGPYYFPLGLIFGAVILYLLLSTKGIIILSPQYQAIVRKTPHVTSQLKLRSWFLALIAIGLLAGIVALL